MKLAIIDRNVQNATMYDAVDYLVKELLWLGIDTDVAPTYKAFLDYYGNLEKYDGILLHLGIKNQYQIKEILNKYNTKPIGLLSYNLQDYELDIPIFEYRLSSQDIKEWLEYP